MTVGLALEDQRTLRLSSAYSPTTGASSEERQAYIAKLRGVRRKPCTNTTDIEPLNEVINLDPSDAR